MNEVARPPRPPLVRGHGLQGEGAAYEGMSRVWIGRGTCACGAQSPVLESDYARKRWHRQHKLDVIAQGAS